MVKLVLVSSRGMVSISDFVRFHDDVVASALEFLVAFVADDAAEFAVGFDLQQENAYMHGYMNCCS